MARAQWLVCAVPVAFLIVMAWHLRWMSDDGFIHLRVVQQVVQGHGPVFNVGERVEASTSPLWVGVLALAYPITGLALAWKAVLLGLVFSVLGLVAAERTALITARSRRGPDTRRELVVPVGVLVIAALPPFWEFATSGLETGMTFGWIGGSCWWCAHRVTRPEPPSPRAEMAGAALVGLGWLIRPDLVLFSLAFGAVLLAAVWPQGRRRRLGVVVAWAALPAAYQVFRMGYYAMVVPNTALAKDAGGAQWARGWRYLSDLMVPYWLWLPLGAVAVLVATQVVADLREAQRLRALAQLAPAAAAIAHGIYVVRVGGDFMHARLLLPAVFGLAAPAGLPVRLEGARPWLRRPSLVAAAVALWALACAGALRPHYDFQVQGRSLPFTDDATIADERAELQLLWRGHDRVRLDVHVHRQRDGRPVPVRGSVMITRFPGGPLLVPLRPMPATSAVALPAIGAVAYAWGPDVYVIDTYSLAHPIGSHLDHRVGIRPGHQKPVPDAWQISEMTPAKELLAPAGDFVASAPDLRAARHAARCGALRRYLHDISAPLSPGRIIGNLADSVPNTLFRVPPRPEDAERTLCPRG